MEDIWRQTYVARDGESSARVWNVFFSDPIAGYDQHRSIQAVSLRARKIPIYRFDTVMFENDTTVLNSRIVENARLGLLGLRINLWATQGCQSGDRGRRTKEKGSSI